MFSSCGKGTHHRSFGKKKTSIAAENSIQHERTGSNQAFVQEVAKLNIAHSMLEIYKRSPILRTMLDEKQIGMIGGFYVTWS